MTLAQAQLAFMAQILDEDAVLPHGWGDRQRAGLDIYRNAYRVRLVETLADVFERTRDWVGEESFRSAAAHHLITHAPNSWTIDHAGAGFDATLAELFANDPEVEELAWLEWAMHCVFVAADCEPLTPQGFGAATAGIADDEWAGLRLSLAPRLTYRPVRFDCGGLWRALSQGADPPDPLAFAAPHGLVVWRERLTPVFRTIAAAELACLDAVAGGGTYGAACDLLVENLGEAEATQFAGSMLGRWLGDGWITAVTAPSDQPSRSS